MLCNSNYSTQWTPSPLRVPEGHRTRNCSLSSSVADPDPPDPYHFFKSEILPDSLKNYTDPHSNTKGDQTILKIEINFVYDSIFSVKERKNARILYATALNFHNTVFFRKPNPYNLLFCLDPDQCHFAWKSGSGSNLKFNYWKKYKKMDTRTVPACFSHVSHKLWTAMRDSYQRQIFRLISKAVWLVRC